MTMTPRNKITFAIVTFAGTMGLGAGLALVPAMAATAVEGRAALPEGALSWGFLAAALATGLSSFGAGLAVASVGSAAVGAVTEKPEVLGRVLILVGLAEGIAIYGLIISILILNRLG
jgi:V/A-type H+-transporting ATPase subunit K